jgi:hypothetical protein
MDAPMLFLFFWFVFIISAMAFVFNLSSKSPQELVPKVSGLDFTPTQMVRASDGRSGLAINEHTCHLCLIKHALTPPHLLSVRSLLGTFLVKNGELVGQGLRTQPPSIQGVLKGIQPKIQAEMDSWRHADCGTGNQRIDLIVAIHDEQEPLHILNFLNLETKEGGILFEKAMNTAKHWHYLLDGFILKADHLEHLQGNIRDSEEPGRLDLMETALPGPDESKPNPQMATHPFKT